MITTERQTFENEIIDYYKQLSEEDKLEFMDFVTWMTTNKPSPEELNAEIERRKEKIISPEFKLQQLAKRLTRKHISTTEVLRREKICEALRFTEPANSPNFCKALTTAAIYDGAPNSVEIAQSQYSSK